MRKGLPTKRYASYYAIPESSAAPNGGSATSLGNSNVTEGQPSVIWSLAGYITSHHYERNQIAATQ